MIRTLLSVVAMVLLAIVGLWAVLAMYDLAAIYADPTGSGLEMLGAFGFVISIAVGLMLGLGAISVALARGRLRRAVLFVAVGLVVTSLAGILVSSHYGKEAKKRETAEPPRCGIGNQVLDEEFRAISHPGYFGGGSSSRVDCSYLLTAEDIGSALDAYNEGLRSMGYAVSPSDAGLVAERPGFRFTARLERPPDGDGFLTVSLHEVAG